LDLNRETIKIFDPACGSSEFLMEALKQLKARGFNGTVNIVGWDSSSTAISTSKFLLTYEKRGWGDFLNVNLKLVEDSLMEAWDNDYDCILMNPPFVSWEQMTSASRSATREALGNSFIGKPNQASAFFFKSINSLRHGGVIGSVIPSSLLTLDAYEHLRKNIYEIISLIIVGKLGNFVFEDALTDVSLIMGKKEDSAQSPLIVWAKNEKGTAAQAIQDLRKLQYQNTQNVIEKNYSIYQPTNFPINSLNWNITSFEDSEFFKRIERFVKDGRLVRVQDIFNVQQGIRTGFNDVFKISPFEYNLVPDNEAKYFRPVIDNDSIKRGKLIKNNYVWYPYNEDGLMIKTAEELIDSANYFYRNKLLPKKEKLSDRSGVGKWWTLTRPRNWQYRKRKGICSTEFGKSDSFAFDALGEFVVERGNAWISKKEFNDDFRFYFYLAIFSSSTFDKLLSVYSKQLLSGWDLGKKFTKNIPIPSVFSQDVVSSYAFEKLALLGMQLAKGELYSIYPIDEVLNSYIYPSSK
jgi:adenine-specific DNA-methyltransferase